MKFLKKALLVLLTPLFPLLLFALAFDYGVVHTVSHPTNVKHIVAQSGLYNSLVPGLIDQAKKTTTDAGSLTLTDPAIQKAATEALNPALLQKDTETAIDSVYRWLDGKTSQPDFSIDLTGPKTVFANGVGSAAQAKAASLPVCPLALSSTDNFDPFSATCLPQGLTADEAGAQAKDKILSGDFLKQTNITAAQAKSGDSNQSLFADQLKNAPKQYQRAKKTPLILGLVVILVGLGIVFTSATWQRGLRHIGITLVIIGVLMLVFSWVLNHEVSQTLVPKIKFNNEVLQSKVQTLAKDLVQSVDKNYWVFGSIYTVLGAAAIGGPIIMNRKRGGSKPAAVPAAAAEKESKEEPASEPVAKPAPTKPKTKIKIIQ